MYLMYVCTYFPIKYWKRINPIFERKSILCGICSVKIFLILLFQVKKGLEEFLFKILVLGVLKNSQGRIWKRSSAHLYLVEHLNANEFLNKPQTQQVVLTIVLSKQCFTVNIQTLCMIRFRSTGYLTDEIQRGNLTCSRY